MILRRITKHVREQNWTVIGIDCVIVVGIVIGFQVTAWGNERAERTREQVLLRGLHADLEVANLVETRWVNTLFVIQDGEPVRQLIEDILRLIEADLER